jgi:hypothetical protein
MQRTRAMKLTAGVGKGGCHFASGFAVQALGLH